MKVLQHHPKGPGSSRDESPPRILLIEDNADHALLERRALQSLGEGVEIEVFESPSQALQALQERTFDLVLADYQVPEMDGLTFLRAVQEAGIPVPVVMVTGLGSEKVAVEALKKGASDYVVKESGYLERLPSVARRALEVFRTQRQLKAARRQLAESEQRLRELVHDLDAVVWEADSEGLKPTFVNQRAESLLGFPRQRWTQDADFRLGMIHPEDRPAVEETWRTAVAGCSQQTVEYRMRSRDGETIWVRDIVRGVVDRDGGVALRGLMVDITAQKKAEAETRRLHKQLLQSQKLESIGTLAGGIAHDFNNIVQAILGNGALGLESVDQAGEVGAYFREIVQAAERARDLTAQLLAFSRPGEKSVRPVQLNRIVNETLLLLRRLIPSTIEIETFLSPDLRPVEVDVTQIQQVLLNLCVNARDAMPQGGRLTISTANQDLDETEAQRQVEASPGAYSVLGVSDDGVGIDAQDLSRIFDPFFTTKGVGEGTGLGLAAAYGTVRGHQGWIQVSSHLGQGTLFEVYLPSTEKAIDSNDSRSLPAGGGTETVLVVDDEDMVRDLVCKILGRYGYRTYQAANGREALQVVEQRAEEIDLVLLDLTMPCLNGVECARRLRTARPRLPLIISSGYVKADEAALDPNIAVFVPKPYRPAELAATVRKVLDTAHAG